MSADTRETSFRERLRDLLTRNGASWQLAPSDDAYDAMARLHEEIVAEEVGMDRVAEATPEALASALATGFLKILDENPLAINFMGLHFKDEKSGRTVEVLLQRPEGKSPALVASERGLALRAAEARVDELLRYNNEQVELRRAAERERDETSSALISTRLLAAEKAKEWRTKLAVILGRDPETAHLDEMLPAVAKLKEAGGLLHRIAARLVHRIAPDQVRDEGGMRAKTFAAIEAWEGLTTDRVHVAAADVEPPFQAGVQAWMLACFGPEVAADQTERCYRFIEEATELVQALGCTADQVRQLVEYVYGRPAGEPRQEVGGVLVTLAALCTAVNADMESAGQAELDRVWTKIDVIREKQRCKPHGSPLPGSSAPAVCSTCNDTHRMMFGREGEEREVPCTRCPTPCPSCRGHLSPYCANTPCSCSCHNVAAATPEEGR